MRVLSNRYSLLIIGCIVLSCVLFFGFVERVHSETSFAAGVHDGNLGSVVIVPSPIQGEGQPDHYQSPIRLDQAKISILSRDNIRHELTVELARTIQEQRVGLMFRLYLEKNKGMLFLFEDERERNFWMKNTSISLDILFVRKDGIIHHIYPNAVINSLARISSHGAVSAVLEIGAGEAEKLGINVGDRILYQAFVPDRLE